MAVCVEAVTKKTFMNILHNWKIFMNKLFKIINIHYYIPFPPYFLFRGVCVCVGGGGGSSRERWWDR